MADKEVYLKRITKGAAIVFIGVILGKLFGYLLRLFIARSFGPEDFGLFSLVSAIFGIVTTLALLGLPKALTRFIPFYLGRGDHAKAKGSVFSALKIVVPLGIAASSIIYLFADLIALYAFKEPGIAGLLQLFAFSITPALIFSTLIGAFRGFQNMRNKVVVEDVTRPLLTLILLVFIFFILDPSVEGTAFAYFFGYVVAVLLGLYLLKGHMKSFGKGVKAAQIGRELIIFSGPLIVANYLGLVITWTDTIMLGIFDTAEVVGLYNAALLTSALLLSIMMPLMYVFLPVITEIYAKGKKEELAEVYGSVLKWGFMASLPFLLVIIFFPDNVMGVLYGQEYVAASFVLIILSIGQMFLLFTRPASNTFIMLGKTRLILMFAIVASVSNLLLNIILIPLFGMLGAAIATLLTFVLIAALRFIFVSRYLELRLLDINHLKALFSGIISMSVFYYLIKSFYSNPPVWLLVVSFPIFLVLYGMLFLVMRGFDNNDVIIMKSIERKTGIKLEFLRKLVKRFL